jgi:hypothetical protein
MFNLAAQWQLQLPNLDNIVPQIPSIPCTPHEQLWQNRNITSLRRVPNPLTVISMCWIPADNSDTAIRGITAGWNALRVVQIHTRWHMRMLLPVATALVGVSVEDSAVSTIRKSSDCVWQPCTAHVNYGFAGNLPAHSIKTCATIKTFMTLIVPQMT